MTNKEKDLLRLKELKQNEKVLLEDSSLKVIGMDEAGRGPIAGPVAVSACIMKDESELEWINDSKKVTEKRRNILYDKIIEDAETFAIVLVNSDIIRRKNVYWATMMGAQIALDTVIEEINLKNEKNKTDIKIGAVITDAMDELKVYDIRQFSIPKADATFYTVSSASILAKVTRDRYISELDIADDYGFKSHKGYGTELHLNKILEHGISSEHRLDFVKHQLENKKEKLEKNNKEENQKELSLVNKRIKEVNKMIEIDDKNKNFNKAIKIIYKDIDGNIKEKEVEYKE